LDQRFAHRDLAHPKPGCDLILAQWLFALQLALHDVLAQGLGNQIASGG
jgi:hypothetical protein